MLNLQFPKTWGKFIQITVFPARQIALKNCPRTQRHKSNNKTQWQKRDLFCISSVFRIYRFILRHPLVEISPKHGWTLLRPTVIPPSPPPQTTYPPISEQMPSMNYGNPATFMYSLQDNKLLPAGRCVYGDNKQNSDNWFTFSGIQNNDLQRTAEKWQWPRRVERGV